MFTSLPKFQTLVGRAAGFTMIELLIVITILGILATAVLSAINPIEQINRGRDTSSRSDAEQLLSAIDRYNAFQQYYPWQDGESADWDLAFSRSNEDSPANTLTPPCAIADLLSNGNDDGTCVGSQELKSSFIDRVTESTSRGLFLYNRGQQGDSTYVCFVPQSGAFRTEAQDRCTDGYPDDIDAGVVTDIICGADGRTDADTMGGDLADDGPAICLP